MVHMLFLFFTIPSQKLGPEPNTFLRSVAPPCEKVIFAFERNYITSAMRKSMSDVPAPGSF